MNYRRPIGEPLLNWISSFLPFEKRTFYRMTVLVLTFLSYFSYHVNRRSISVVKPALHHDNCSNLIPPENVNTTEDDKWCNWAPFDGNNSHALLGYIDTAYLISYAVCMYFSGIIADRVDLRYFLSFGMIMVGVCHYAFGLAYYLNIHVLWYFLVIAIINGAFASTGWPNVAAVVGHWFGPSHRGLIFGIWNVHVRFGNIAGALIAGAFVDYNWGLSFIVPGIMMAIFGIIIFIFLVPQPKNVGLGIDDEENLENRENNKENHQSIDNSEAISFWGALKIPGVIEFSLCLFFTKMVSYTFLYWLPLYIKEKTGNTAGHSAFLSIFFDIGGILGGIIAGYLTDRTGSGALTCALMLLLAIPSGLNMILQFIAGTFVNAPYSLITTAVSTELGTTIKSVRALATVAAIIDATGSFGSPVGTSITGVISQSNWNNVFYMVICANILGLFSIMRIAIKDLRRIRASKK